MTLHPLTGCNDVTWVFIVFNTKRAPTRSTARLPEGSGFTPVCWQTCEDSVTERTPTEYRAILDAWRETAPSNDSDILPQTRLSASPRHAYLADQLAVLLRWRTHRESNEPVQTNFLQADNDNNEVGEISSPKRDTDCELEIRPSPAEIMTALEGVILREKLNGTLVPVGGDIEYETEMDNPPRWRPFVRLGGLQFSVTEGSLAYPRGSLTFWKAGNHWERPIDSTGTPKGSANPKLPPTKAPLERTTQCDALASKQEATYLNDNLAPDDIAALDASLSSDSFRALGETLGYRGKTAERRGKRRLLLAARNLATVLEKLSA